MDTINDSSENLERSVQGFNQENMQLKSFLRLSTKSTTPKRISLQNANHLRKELDDVHQLNDSARMLAKSYNNSKLMKVHDLMDIDSSITLAPHEIRDIMTTSEKNELTLREMMEDSSATGIILKTKEPWREIMSKLYYDFLHSIQMNFSETQIFDTVADFIQNCSDTLDIMRGIQITFY